MAYLQLEGTLCDLDPAERDKNRGRSESTSVSRYHI